jgi:hypothetical protein
MGNYQCLIPIGITYTGIHMYSYLYDVYVLNKCIFVYMKVYVSPTYIYIYIYIYAYTYMYRSVEGLEQLRDRADKATLPLMIYIDMFIYDTYPLPSYIYVYVGLPPYIYIYIYIYIFIYTHIDLLKV